jgi:hypothetical protein
MPVGVWCTSTGQAASGRHVRSVGTRRWQFVAAAVLLISGCGSLDLPEGTALVPPNGGVTRFQRHMAVDDPIMFGIEPLRATGQSPVHLLRAAMLDVPDGFVVDGIWALRYSEPGSGVTGVMYGTKEYQFSKQHFHALDQVTLDPTCPPVARCVPGPNSVPYQDWFLLVQAHTARPGDYQTAVAFRSCTR